MTQLRFLLSQIEPLTKNDRVIRENFRRIKDYLESVEAGETTLVTFTTIGGTPSNYLHTDEFDVSSNGQTVFNLSYSPAKPTTAIMVINGVVQTYGTHFTISGNVLTFDSSAAGFTLETSNEFGQADHVSVHYLT